MEETVIPNDDISYPEMLVTFKEGSEEQRSSWVDEQNSSEAADLRAVEWR
jgi:hypothetical protein